MLAGCQNSPEASLLLAGQPASDGEAESWAYRRIDPNVAGQRVYSIYSGGGCMYALFGGILLCLSDKCGGVFSSFPLDMMKYGAGGVGGWGTLCGALNGAAAAIGLFVADKQRREDLIAELFSWYESTPLPQYRPTMGGQPHDVVATAAQSVLCHVSVGKWCHTSGSAVESKEKTERCRRLTVDVCMKVVELLNRYFSLGAAIADGAPNEQNASKAQDVPPAADVMGKMRCDTCHQLTEHSDTVGLLLEE